MNKEKVSIVKAGTAGAATGLVNGFFGAGGGMLLVPLLTGLCRLDDKIAFASSISVILPISIVTLITYAMQGSVEFPASLPYLIGGAVGGILGGLFFRRISAVMLHRLLGLFILWGGIRLVMA